MTGSGTRAARLDHVERERDVHACLHGEIDLGHREMVQAALNELIATGKDISINVADLDFMDVGTAKLLMQAADEARRHGHDLRVVNPQPIVRRLLILLGMDALLRPRPVPDLKHS